MLFVSPAAAAAAAACGPVYDLCTLYVTGIKYVVPLRVLPSSGLDGYTFYFYDFETEFFFFSIGFVVDWYSSSFYDERPSRGGVVVRTIGINRYDSLSFF